MMGTHYNAAMPSAPDSTLLSTLPARALLGRLLAVRVSLIAGWAAGIAWLHWGLHIPMPLLPMGAVLALMGVFSLSTAWRLRQDVPATQMEFLAHLLADLTAFAVLVFFSGGVTNPFVSLMLVPVVIAAISLRPRWVWLLVAVAGGLYALLLFYYQPLAVADPVAAYGMHLAGMWFNFLISAGLIAFFVTRMHAALRGRDRELTDLREKQLRDERIVALGTQAALAAHAGNISATARAENASPHPATQARQTPAESRLISVPRPSPPTRYRLWPAPPLRTQCGTRRTRCSHGG